MKAGERNKLTGQVGEHLVAAILGTKGYYASPYSGNVPGFDITAVDSDTLKSFPIQVKTSNGGSLLRTNIDKWAEFSVDKDKRQKLGNYLPRAHPGMIWIVVWIKGNDISTARFFIATEKEIQETIVKHYQRFLDQCDSIRPRKHKSTQTMLTKDELVIFEDNWDVLRLAHD
ncbi:MAG: hypothetical protein HGB26_02750 [Desulfobulbaceae bacterium]|nr:hypothetical protein [Desulfobulbaceae bacterium]